jgi:hypothetical protein
MPVVCSRLRFTSALRFQTSLVLVDAPRSGFRGTPPVSVTDRSPLSTCCPTLLGNEGRVSEPQRRPQENTRACIGFGRFIPPSCSMLRLAHFQACLQVWNAPPSTLCRARAPKRAHLANDTFSQELH